MRLPFFVLLGGLLLASTSILYGEDKKDEAEQPKEAAIEEVTQDVSPELRNQIADLLSKEVERVTAQLETEEKELEELRAKLKTQAAQVDRSKLTLKFLNDRLKQWRPEPSEDSAED